jgi:triphosphoribosyl-dephospho-CoA synthase
VTPAHVGAAAQLACLLEVSAAKPGNVSPGRHFEDVRYEDFVASAVAIGRPMSLAASRPVGETILDAIQATSRWTNANTNLGIVLLVAPLARAALQLRASFEPASSQLRAGSELAPSWLRAGSELTDGLRSAVGDVIARTTVDDASQVYAAIRLASPGGLGTADDENVAGEPTRTLSEVMKLAADRDGIAREYATSFEVTFTVGCPALRAARRDGLDWEAAVVETYLTLLATAPDTHIRRRAGAELAAEVQRFARDAIGAGGVRSAEGRKAINQMDTAMRGPRNLANPGTTADITAASIFALLLSDGWPLPKR